MDLIGKCARLTILLVRLVCDSKPKHILYVVLKNVFNKPKHVSKHVKMSHELYSLALVTTTEAILQARSLNRIDAVYYKYAVDRDA